MSGNRGSRSALALIMNYVISFWGKREGSLVWFFTQELRGLNWASSEYSGAGRTPGSESCDQWENRGLQTLLTRKWGIGYNLKESLSQLHSWNKMAQGPRKLEGTPRKYFDLNKNENMTYQHLWNATKEIIRRKCIPLNAYIRKAVSNPS